MLRFLNVAAFLAVTTSAAASVTISVDRLDPSDGGHQPPPHVLVVDVLVDISPEDTWTVSGFRGLAYNGARFVYASDPNQPGSVLLSRPGTQQRFTCFGGRPHPRDADERFTSGGVGLLSYCRHGGGVPTAQPDHLDVAFFRSPPATSGSPSVDGAILRIALSVIPGCNADSATIFPVGGAPPQYTRLMESTCGPLSPGAVAATYDVPTLVGLNWGIYALLETGPPCAGDFDCSGRVSLPDLALLLSSFGECSGSPLFLIDADFNQDGCIGLVDLSTFLPLFDSDCP